MVNFANLAEFTLGEAELGAGLGQLYMSEPVPIVLVDTNTMLMSKILSDIITSSIADVAHAHASVPISEVITTSIDDIMQKINLKLSQILTTSIDEENIVDFIKILKDTLTTAIGNGAREWHLYPPAEDMGLVGEEVWYPTLAQAAIIGRIVLRIDITSIDVCNAIEESGMTIYLNGEPERAYLFPKQVGQKFESNKQIFAGDAVMFSCPDLTIKITDIVYHNGLYYTIIAITDDFIGGNLIVRKSGLRRISEITGMPQPTGLVASENLEGKTSLTWDPINDKVYTNFNVYLVGRAHTTFGTLFATAIDSVRNDPPAVVVGTPGTVYYLIGTTPTGTWVGHAGAVTRWDGSAWVYITSFAVKDLVAVIADKNYYYCTGAGTWAQVPWEIIETTKNNAFLDKNITPMSKYTYCIIALDLYNNSGFPSALAVTPIDETPPPKVKGLR